MSTAARVLLNRLLAKARFRHLQVMVRLAEIGTLKRTAESIGLTQPAVTQLLADLETLLEVELFHRHARGVIPTSVCLDLLPLARQSLSGLHNSAELVAERSHIGEGLVRISSSTAGINGLLSLAIPTFNQRYPATQLLIQEEELYDQFMAITRQQLDMGICRQTEVVPAGWQFVPLLEDEFVIVCAPEHPLTRHSSVCWADVAKATWLPPPVDSAARHQLDELGQRLPKALRINQVVTRVSSMTWAMLQQQELLTLVPASVFRQLRAAAQLVVLPLDERLPFLPLGMLLPSQDCPAATQRLADFLRDFFGSSAFKSIDNRY